MDASLRLRAEQLANEFAGQATTAEEISGLMRLMMKSALERMLNTELDVHLGRRSPVNSAEAGRSLNENLPLACNRAICVAGDPKPSGLRTAATGTRQKRSKATWAN